MFQVVVLSTILLAGCSYTDWHVSSDIPGVAQSIAKAQMNLTRQMPINCSAGSKVEIKAKARSKTTSSGFINDSFEYNSKCDEPRVVVK